MGNAQQGAKDGEHAPVKAKAKKSKSIIGEASERRVKDKAVAASKKVHSFELLRDAENA